MQSWRGFVALLRLPFLCFLSLRFHDLLVFIFVFTCVLLHACFFMHVSTCLFEALSHHNFATAAISKAHDVDATLGGLLNLHAVDGVDGDRSVG